MASLISKFNKLQQLRGFLSMLFSQRIRSQKFPKLSNKGKAKDSMRS